MDRLRHLILPLALLGLACEDEKPEAPPPARFAGVKLVPAERAASKAAESFCERVFPKSGEGSRRFLPPPERALPTPSPGPETPGGGWTWINLWASWCGPCLAEMPLLERWRASLAKDGMPVRFEMWTIDTDLDALATALRRPYPGPVRWLRGEDDLPAFLESLGVQKGTAIPIHALVDPAGMLRCVRVGSVGEEAYGSLKTIFLAP